jgi:hypothetical protein
MCVLLILTYWYAYVKYHRTLGREGFAKMNYSDKSLAIRCYKLLLIAIFFCYPGITTKIFLMWKCVDIGDKSYLYSQMSIECYESPVHQQYLVYSTICMVVYVIGIPLVMFAVLYRARKDIQNHPDDLATRMKYGMLYSSYEPAYYYFEVVEMARKLLMTGGLILLGSGSPMQVRTRPCAAMPPTGHTLAHTTSRLGLAHNTQ